MGLINSNTLNNNLMGIWSGIKRIPKDLKGLLGADVQTATQQAMTNPQPANPEQWLNAGMELSGMAPVGGLLAHTVYHGSPHKFSKFDMSKIGTGEGAQAYGHGLYFAESPGVARSYQQGLSQTAPRVMTWKGQQIGFDDLKSVAEQYANNLPADQKAFALDSMTRMLRNQSGYGTPKFYDQLKQVKSKISKNLKQANSLKGSQYDNPSTRQWYEQFKTMLDDINVEYPGNLYKVDIPDESIPRMLDWDRSLDQQSPEVIAALEKVGITQPWELVSDTGHALGRTFKTQAEALAEAPAGWTARVRPSTNKGNAVYENLAAQVGKAGRYDNPLPKDYAATSELLKQAGIPGIRYLDGNSRGTGGTSNFVLFDDQLPRILEINGQPTGLLSYADEAAQAAKKDGGLLDISKWKANDIFGNGKQIEYLSPDGRSAVVQQTMPSGETVFYPAEVNAEYGWVSPDMYKPFSTFDEARNKIKGMRVSDSLKKRNVERYGAIPNTWTGEAKKIAKKLIDSGIDITRFSGSTQSKSKYIELADGRKIRMSDHDLPLSYEGSDIDFRYGNDIAELMNKLK